MSLGIVLVSHVSDVVIGIEKLIREVAKNVPITKAGGTEENGIGTSFEKILTAFEENTGDELLAFYDLGSAKMNLEMAMEMSDKPIRLYDTALLESSYTAAALIQADATIEAIESQLNLLKIK